MKTVREEVETGDYGQAEMGDELHFICLRHTIAPAGRDRTVCIRNIIHSLLLQLWMQSAMSAIKESVSEIQGGF